MRFGRFDYEIVVIRQPTEMAQRVDFLPEHTQKEAKRQLQKFKGMRKPGARYELRRIK